MDELRAYGLVDDGAAPAAQGVSPDSVSLFEQGKAQQQQILRDARQRRN